MKDYYKILGLPPTATLQEIKIAYRKLAHLFHPDKNPDDTAAETRFNLIKEAYTVLTTPALKDQFHQELWLNRAMGKKAAAPALTPSQILTGVLAANQRYLLFDEYRVDREGIYHALIALIDTEKITILNNFRQQDISDETVRRIQDCFFLITPKNRLKLLEHLEQIDVSERCRKQIQDRRNQVKNEIRFNQLKPYLIILLIIVLCMIIAYSL